MEQPNHYYRQNIANIPPKVLPMDELDKSKFDLNFREPIENALTSHFSFYLSVTWGYCGMDFEACKEIDL